MMKKFLLFALLAFGLVRTGAGAGAAQFTLVQSNAFAASASPIVNFTPSTNGDYHFYLLFPMSVNQFNPAWGALQSVTLSFEFDWSGSLKTGSSGGNGSISDDGSFYVNGTNVVYGTGNGNGGSGPAGSTLTLNFTNGPTADTDNGLSNPQISTGDGTFMLSYQPTFTISVSGITNAQASFNGGYLSVTYTYLPTVVITNVAGDGGNLSFDFYSTPGHTNTVQVSTNLLSGTWLDLTNYSGDGNLKQFATPLTNAPDAFFRVKIQ